MKFYVWYNYSEALVDQSGIKGGWIPEFIPKSSFEIKGEYQVDDPGSVQVNFRFKPNDLQSFDRFCSKIIPSNDEIIFSCQNEYVSGYLWCFKVNSRLGFAKGWAISSIENCD